MSVRVDRAALVVVLDASGMSDRELARRAGLGHATVGHLVSGRRQSCTERTARAVARALGVAPGLLFSRDDVSGRVGR